jgi:hypothetical protein
VTGLQLCIIVQLGGMRVEGIELHRRAHGQEVKAMHGEFCHLTGLGCHGPVRFLGPDVVVPHLAAVLVSLQARDGDIGLFSPPCFQV